MIECYPTENQSKASIAMLSEMVPTLSKKCQSSLNLGNCLEHSSHGQFPIWARVFIIWMFHLVKTGLFQDSLIACFSNSGPPFKNDSVVSRVFPDMSNLKYSIVTCGVLLIGVTYRSHCKTRLEWKKHFQEFIRQRFPQAAIIVLIQWVCGMAKIVNIDSW